MGEIYTPRFWIADKDDPIRYSYDSGGLPGSECRLLLNIMPGMRGVYSMRDLRVQLDLANGLTPTVRLLVERSFKI